MGVAETWQAEATTVLDVRPILARGDEPFVPIMEAAEPLEVGEVLVLLAPFEPAPLYGVLGGRGFSHQSQALGGGDFIIRFERERAGAGAVPNTPPGHDH